MHLTMRISGHKGNLVGPFNLVTTTAVIEPETYLRYGRSECDVFFKAFHSSPKLS